MACGGELSSGYFRLLDLQVSDMLFHISVVARVKERLNPKPESGIQIPGGVDSIDWE